MERESLYNICLVTLGSNACMGTAGLNHRMVHAPCVDQLIYATLDQCSYQGLHMTPPYLHTLQFWACHGYFRL